MKKRSILGKILLGVVASIVAVMAFVAWDYIGFQDHFVANSRHQNLMIDAHTLPGHEPPKRILKTVRWGEGYAGKHVFSGQIQLDQSVELFVYRSEIGWHRIGGEFVSSGRPYYGIHAADTVVVSVVSSRTNVISIEEIHHNRFTLTGVAPGRATLSIQVRTTSDEMSLVDEFDIEVSPVRI